jgi:hypothetical protein
LNDNRELCSDPHGADTDGTIEYAMFG